jgi:dipeptidyl-peptidase III
MKGIGTIGDSTDWGLGASKKRRSSHCWGPSKRSRVTVAQRLKHGLGAFLFLILTASIWAESPLIEIVDTTAFIRIGADGFPNLSPRQQALTYWLNQSSIAIDPIIYDQLSRFGLRQKRLLEAVVSNKAKVNPVIYGRVSDFAKLFWANKGNHNETTAQKFLPKFTANELKRALGEAGRQDLVPEVDELAASLFDAEFEPTIIARSAGSGKVVEQVYRAGTPDGKVPPGLYAQYLRKANELLEQARRYAEPAQARVISDLIRYYQTGEDKDRMRFETDWVQDNEPVDFVSGFIGVDRDARGVKGTSQSFVSIRDQNKSNVVGMIAANAQYFEDRAPWDARYKRQDVKPPIANAVETTIETGDFHVATMGASFPNEDKIRAKYGLKSFLFFDEAPAMTGTVGFAGFYEFAATRDDADRDRKYRTEAERLMAIMHEVIGHGSGKLSPKLTHEPEFYLKEYFSAMEEARADSMALWNVFDPKLKELGLVSSDEVGKAMYDIAALQMLVQLRYIPNGDTIEDNRQRARQLIAQYILDKTGAIAMEDRNGKTYVYVKDYGKMREGVGMLLAELMRIKAEGDYDAIKALTEKYGAHFDPKLRDQMVERFRKGGTSFIYFAGINPDLTAQFDGAGNVTKVDIDYSRNYVEQQLSYSAMFPELGR